MWSIERSWHSHYQRGIFPRPQKSHETAVGIMICIVDGLQEIATQHGTKLGDKTKTVLYRLVEPG
jgi:hypothetical protein